MFQCKIIKMKALINSAFFIFLFSGCYSLFGPKTDVTAFFELEITSADTAKAKEILLNRLSDEFYKNNILLENNGSQWILTITNYDSIETPLSALRKLITSQGKLEFWETFDNKDIYSSLTEVDSYIARDSVMNNISEEEKSDTSQLAKYKREHPLIGTILFPYADESRQALIAGPVAGIALIKDTAKAMEYLSNYKIKNLLPRNLRFAWTMNPPDRYKRPSYNKEEVSVRGLIALKTSNEGNEARLSGNIISDAGIRYDKRSGGFPYVETTMNDEGAKIWETMTEENTGKAIAITVDGEVYSYPTVMSKIVGGKSTITGNFTPEEARTLVSILKSSGYSYSVKIAGEHIIREQK